MLNESELKKRTINAIEYVDDQMIITLTDKLDEETSDSSLFLLLTERNTEKELSFPLKQIKIVEEAEMSIYQAIIDLPQHLPEFQIEERWDLFIVNFDEEETEKRRRLKSNFANYMLTFYLDKKTNKLIVPYTTNRGNISFHIKDYDLFSQIEEMSLSEDGLFSFSGYAIIPELHQSDVMNTAFSIILKDNQDQHIHSIALEQIKEEEITSPNIPHRMLRFQGEDHLQTFFVNDLTNKVSVKAYLVFTYEQNGGKMSKETPPLQYEMKKNKFSARKAIVKHNGDKFRVKLKASKKLQNIGITIEKYSLLKDLRTSLQRAKVRIRRHRKVKQAYKLAFKLVGKLPAKKNLIMFESFLGKQYSCNPRAIYEYLQKHHPEFKMYWSVDRRHTKVFKDKDIPYIRRFSVKWLFSMASARYWVTNSRMPLWIPKPKHTIYLQTWHGTPLKRLAVDMDEVHMPGTTTKKYKRNFIKESSNWDYLISPNRYSTEIFRRAFQFDRRMIESGYPRNDYLYVSNNEKTINTLKTKYGLPLDKKIILYAPTWRDNQFYGKGRYKFDLALDLQHMREILGNDYIVILRMHYLVAENFDLTPYEGFAYDFSTHEDIRDLYLISDILVTDYSSVFFDFANLKRPMIFYVYDIDTYRDKLRGFYFDFENKAPGPLVKTTEEVIQTIQALEKTDKPLSESFDAFYDKFCYLESGQSTKRVVDEVFLGRTTK